ncbi:sn-glycerol-3-phosphate ABC transporter ATP-binding protein UgpC [Mesorhizobium sp. DCY119]|uniref:ABC transporter ATP-binding protein n=1 Tax=Mesorhizobium sp. DCY119 TaxID=2108445 RepID=UPI000E6D0611|nr:sn-glycerol-3-phosphate ABC transporter ATP-binding protein UgpC [Mesorhizobium sp. DCY119]RJG46270.1 sn-glycerol-3-phosphate ABC transporter ATP-binding protein UgpC [Mesorhizobium sp. DCY119]
MTNITITDLEKRYGSVGVLHDIHLTINQGEFVVLVGPSGCGKSTLLRIIAGLETISSGVISFGGRPVNALAPQDRNIAMVFQSYALYPHMTVRKNLAFGLEQAKMPRAEIERRVLAAARTLNIEQMMDRYPRSLSGGQRQRVAMGRAMVREPVAFLFDEPLSNLDAQLRVTMRSEIRSLQRQLGVTTVYVTHDQVEAMTMADRIVLMKDGRIVQVGTPLELYDNPSSAFVAQFIGSPQMNMLTGINVGQRIRVGEGPSSPSIAAPSGAPGDILVGVRPEHMRLASDRDAGEHGFSARVRNVEQLGFETELILDTGKELVTIKQAGRIRPQIGETVNVAFLESDALLFDRRSGDRIFAGVGQA